MYIDPEFQFLQDFDLQKHRTLIEKIKNIDWDHESLSRQDGLNFTGKSTVIFYDFLEQDTELYDQNLDPEVELIKKESFEIVNDILSNFPGFSPVKGEISCCFPRSLQKYHVDPRMFHRYCKRIHIPLVTNDKSYLSVGYNNYSLEEGKIYEFNNIVSHRSVNLGNMKRIHIILDIMNKLDLDKCLEKFGPAFFDRVPRNFKWQSLD